MGEINLTPTQVYKLGRSVTVAESEKDHGGIPVTQRLALAASISRSTSAPVSSIGLSARCAVRSFARPNKSR